MSPGRSPFSIFCSRGALPDPESINQGTSVTNDVPPAQNIVRYSFREKTYKLDPSVEQCALHFEMEGNLMHRYPYVQPYGVQPCAQATLCPAPTKFSARHS